jgi:hypothetical protein
MNNVLFFHGAAVIRIIRHESFRTVKLYEENSCSYLINRNAGVYIKYSKHGSTNWRFTFSEEHVREISEMRERLKHVYVSLICNENGICCLDWSEFTTVISTENEFYPKWIAVSRMKGEKYSVWGSDGELRHKVGDIDFPRKIFKRYD